MGVSKNRGTPKWMVYNWKTLLKWDDLGGPPLFLETPIWLLLNSCRLRLPGRKVGPGRCFSKWWQVESLLEVMVTNRWRQVYRLHVRPEASRKDYPGGILTCGKSDLKPTMKVTDVQFANLIPKDGCLTGLTEKTWSIFFGVLSMAETCKAEHEVEMLAFLLEEALSKHERWRIALVTVAMFSWRCFRCLMCSEWLLGSRSPFGDGGWFHVVVQCRSRANRVCCLLFSHATFYSKYQSMVGLWFMMVVYQ